MSPLPSLSPLKNRYRESARPWTREEIASCGLFDQLELSTLWGLLDHCLCFELSPGEVLVDMDDSTPCMFFVLSGKFSVHVGSVEAEAVAEVLEGESVGEMRLIDGRKASAIVIAKTDARVLAVGPEAFWGLIQSSHEFTVNLLGLFARRLRGNNAAVDESRRLQAEYKRHASVDGLTGLYNRRRLDEVLPRYLARAEHEKGPTSVLMTDVDHFKKFNDRFGHHAGDLVLYEVAKVLRDRCRPTDFVARYGGEEFTVVLPGASAEDSLIVGERLRKAVEQLSLQLENGAPLPPVTISIGIAELRSGDQAKDILVRADKALYAAKEGGRNRCMVADESQLLREAR